MRKLIIAIDGAAASGKSTTAKLVAKRLNYLHIDTGAMYRAAAYAVLKNNIDPNNQKAVEELVANTTIRLKEENGVSVYLDGKPVDDEIRSSEVTKIVSKVSSYKGVRDHLVKEQREIGKDGGVVLEGRDIGTVVFPDAELKLFFVADVQERAHRRHMELKERGEDVEIDNLQKEIMQRDHFDSTRKTSPLKKASDAITVDTSNLTIEQQVEYVLSLVRDKLSESSKNN